MHDACALELVISFSTAVGTVLTSRGSGWALVCHPGKEAAVQFWTLGQVAQVVPIFILQGHSVGLPSQAFFARFHFGNVAG